MAVWDFEKLVFRSWKTEIPVVSLLPGEQNIIVLTKNPIVSNPPASEDLKRNGSTENIIVLTENPNVAIPSASEDFDRNGSTENLIVSTHDGSRVGDDEIVTVSEPEPTNMAELQKL